MGARSLNRVQFTMERNVLRLFGRGTGAATSNLTGVKGAGVTSIVRTGVGSHTITLADKWPGLLMFSASILDANATPDDWEVTVVEELVATSKTIKIAIFKGGAATDLTTDRKLLFEAVLSNNTTPPKGY